MGRGTDHTRQRAAPDRVQTGREVAQPIRGLLYDGTAALRSFRFVKLKKKNPYYT